MCGIGCRDERLTAVGEVWRGNDRKHEATDSGWAWPGGCGWSRLRARRGIEKRCPRKRSTGAVGGGQPASP